MGTFFLRPPPPALDGRPVTSGAVQQRTTLERERDFTKSHRSARSSLTNQYQQEQIGNESVGLMILNVTD